LHGLFRSHVDVPHADVSHVDVSIETMIDIVKSYSEHCYNGVISYWGVLTNSRHQNETELLQTIVKSFNEPANDENCRRLLSTLLKTFITYFADTVEEKDCTSDFYISLGNETLQEYGEFFEMQKREAQTKSKFKKQYIVFGVLFVAALIGGSWCIARLSKHLTAERERGKKGERYAEAVNTQQHDVLWEIINGIERERVERAAAEERLQNLIELERAARQRHEEFGEQLRSNWEEERRQNDELRRRIESASNKKQKGTTGKLGWMVLGGVILKIISGLGDDGGGEGGDIFGDIIIIE
jgi:hypothetical protein